MTRLRFRKSGVRIPAKKSDFLFFRTSTPVLGPSQPLTKLVMELFSRVKWPKPEASYPLPSSGILIMSGATPLPLHGGNTDNFNFYLLPYEEETAVTYEL